MSRSSLCVSGPSQKRWNRSQFLITFLESQYLYTVILSIFFYTVLQLTEIEFYFINLYNSMYQIIV